MGEGVELRPLDKLEGVRLRGKDLQLLPVLDLLLLLAKTKYKEDYITSIPFYI